MKFSHFRSARTRCNTMAAFSNPVFSTWKMSPFIRLLIWGADLLREKYSCIPNEVVQSLELTNRTRPLWPTSSLSSERMGRPFWKLNRLGMYAVRRHIDQIFCRASNFGFSTTLPTRDCIVVRQPPRRDRISCCGRRQCESSPAKP